jgi:3'-5' exoribonuclease
MEPIAQPQLDGAPALLADGDGGPRESSAEPAAAPAKVFVRDLADGQAVECAFVVRDRNLRQKRNGEPFLKLELGDATGAVEAVVWDGVDEAADVAAPGQVVVATGRHGVDARYGPCLKLRAIRRASPDEYDAADLLEGPSAGFDQMVADLRDLVATVRQPKLRELLGRFFDEGSELWARWSEAPAAKRYHQAYRHGLLEHSLSVAQGVSTIAATFPGIDRDVAVTGALLHDVGKVDAYASRGGAIELTDAGKLQGEIALGYFMVRRAIEEIPAFPPDLAEAVLHIILSHHGQLEHGSPVVPCTREATLVHMIDNLGGRLGSFDRLEKGLPEGERWSAFDRGISASAYFADRADAEAA